MITNQIITTTEEELKRVFRNILLEFGLEQKEETIGAEEAMEIIGCTHNTLYFHTSQNGLPRLGKGKSKLRFLRSEVVAWNKRRAEEKQKENKAKKDKNTSLLTENHEFIKAQFERPKNNR